MPAIRLIALAALISFIIASVGFAANHGLDSACAAPQRCWGLVRGTLSTQALADNVRQAIATSDRAKLVALLQPGYDAELEVSAKFLKSGQYAAPTNRMSFLEHPEASYLGVIQLTDETGEVLDEIPVRRADQGRWFVVLGCKVPTDTGAQWACTD